MAIEDKIIEIYVDGKLIATTNAPGITLNCDTVGESKKIPDTQENRDLLNTIGMESGY